MKKDTGTNKRTRSTIMDQITTLYKKVEKEIGNITNIRDSSPNAKKKSKKGEINIEERTKISPRHGRDHEGERRRRTGSEPSW